MPNQNHKSPDKIEDLAPLDVDLSRLSSLRQLHIECGKRMLKDYLYPTDLLAIAALDRSMKLRLGFEDMIRGRNLTCAGPLLRLEIDTVLRFFATTLVKNSDEFAMDVLRGEQIDKYKDAQGRRLTDRYLVDLLGQQVDWLPRVYERTCGYVHFSATHMFASITVHDSPNPGAFTGQITDVDKSLPPELYQEAVDAFCAANELLLEIMLLWCEQKESYGQIRSEGADSEVDKPSGKAGSETEGS